MIKSKDQASTKSNTTHTILAVFMGLFSRRWRWATLIVIIGVMILGRLGIWQINRHQQRQITNKELSTQLATPPFVLNVDTPPEDITTLNNRAITGEGYFDFDQQVILKLQNWAGSGDGKGLITAGEATGADLITPFVLAETNKAILVNRGWIPDSLVNEDGLRQFNTPSGQTTLNGYIRLSQTLSGNQAEQTTTPQLDWFRIDVEGIARQLPYEVYSFYVLQSPPQVPQETLPYRRSIDIDLSDGPHLGYAGQWFIFAAILGFGYLYYLYKILKDEQINPET